MGRFDGILLCTDLDGTLFRDDKTVSRENLDAIEYFKREGGAFAFITGRMPFYVGKVYDTVRPNVPYGCANGGAVYDGERGVYVHTSKMADGVLTLAAAVEENFPHIGIEVSTYGAAYFYKDNGMMEYFREITGLPNLRADYRAITDPIAKVLLTADDAKDIFALGDFLRAHPLASRFALVSSEEHLFEIEPKEAFKGNGLLKLAEYLGIDMKKTVAVGDYDNDVTMLRAAGVGVAVANASPAARAAADRLTVSNNESALARVIADIESGEIAL